MTVVERERLSFTTDLHDPKSVYSFPEEFVIFLQEHGRDFEANQFMAMVKKYMEDNHPEDWNLTTIVAIGAMFADIYDISGVPFEDNVFLKDDTPKDAEEVLEDLDKDVPRPEDVEPDYPEAVLEVSDGDTLEDLIYYSIVELRKQRYARAADQLARELRQLLYGPEPPTPIQIIRLIRSYVTVEVALEGD